MVMEVPGQLGFMPSRSDSVSRQGIMGSARRFMVFVFLILLPEVAFGSRYYSSDRQMMDVVPADIPPPSGDPVPSNQPPSPTPPFPPPPFLPTPPPPVLQPPPSPVLQPPPSPVLVFPAPQVLQPPSPPAVGIAPPEVVFPPPAEVPPPAPVESFPPAIVTPDDTWNESEKAGVVIASIAALLQVAVVAFLLVKRHQMLTTVEYDDIDDLEYDNPRDNPNFRHADSV